jgi:hypothetical protein
MYYTRNSYRRRLFPFAHSTYMELVMTFQIKNTSMFFFSTKAFVFLVLLPPSDSKKLVIRVKCQGTRREGVNYSLSSPTQIKGDNYTFPPPGPSPSFLRIRSGTYMLRVDFCMGGTDVRVPARMYSYALQRQKSCTNTK